MDKLKAIARQLSEEESNEFVAFINRKKTISNRKDLLLFELMREKVSHSPDDYCRAIYGEEAVTNNYHSLRKRLFKHLISFVVLRRMDDDQTGASQLMGHVSLVRYLLDLAQDELAWFYLIKSEKLAIQTQQYDLLNDIYKLQIANADSEHATPLNLIIDKKKQYKKIADIEESAVLALSLIRQRLNEVKYDGRQLDFDKIISKTLNEFELTAIAYNNPKHVYHILSIIRTSILAKKDFYSFEPYALKNYENLSSAGVFNKENHFYKLSILYVVCHVLYRNRKFNDALKVLQDFKKALQEYNRVYFKRFYSRYIGLMAATKSFLGSGHESINMIEKALRELNHLKEPERLSMLLNLGLYYFQQGNIKQANLTEVRMGHTPKWYEKKMGMEWVMKKDLMAIIIQYELGNDEIVTNRITAFKRSYGYLFHNPLYRRVELYIALINEIQINPSLLSRKTFEEEIMPKLVSTQEEKEDLQAMSFYSWLKSKFYKRNFYEVLLETVQPG